MTPHMNRSIFDFHSYKSFIKFRVQELKKARPQATLKWVAKQLGIQYTYLSKCLNDDVTHLNEDHLYEIGRILQLSPVENQYLSILRAHETTHNKARKSELFVQAEKMRKAHPLDAEQIENFRGRIAADVEYLLNPMCMIVHAALTISAVAKDPRKLCSAIGINTQNLKTILKILEQNDYVIIGEDGYEVTKVKKSHFHFGREHPLMRTHQALLKAQLQARLQRTIEEEKQSFLVTLTMNRDGFDLINEEFNHFIKKAESITKKAPASELYQLSFDLFKWF